MSTTRTESDSMGPMQVPADAYYAAQTARALENFPISNFHFPRRFIRALGLIKQHAAKTNESLGLLDSKRARSIQEAAQEVADGRWDSQFVVDVFQTGSGTSTNMNANEVIANRAIELRGGRRGDQSVHPNDHVNCCQSSNDVIPTAIHLAALEALHEGLIPALKELHAALAAKEQEFQNVIKIGRTHLQDATPMSLGQEFGGYASQVEHGIRRLESLDEHLGELALGGTAVGTGINAHPDFARLTIEALVRATGLPLREAKNHFEAQAGKDACVEASGALKTIAVSLIKIANDIRFLGSGPRCGLGELKLPATQPGSSIMPGKVNPVMSEMLLMVCAQVIGNDASITLGGLYGNFELNVMMPLIGHNLLQSIELLAQGSRVFARRCVAGLAADREHCESMIEQSLAMVTVLAPVIGYEKAAALAKKAYLEGRSIREVAAAESGLDAVTLKRLLDPVSQTKPPAK
ncbi:MAG: class II fumarate hydratase [Methylacidiphilales bacterium]|nr:class II fumarate hydratase [Candidatus Methylacidiphilales bacterium]